MTRRSFWIPLSSLLLHACGTVPADEPVASTVPAPSTSQRDAPADAPRCHDPSDAERLAVAVGETVRTRFGIAVTYEGTEHDSFDDGGFDFAAKLRFQGVMEDGSLTPSELRWRPSLVAPPRWVHLSMSVCVRLEEGGDERVILQLHPAS